MGYEAKILADSLSPAGVRLTTMQVTFPRIVLAEFNTHRMLSRNSASSRAIPVRTQLDRVRREPFLPVHWGRNQKGMQATAELAGVRLWFARVAWRMASRGARAMVRVLNALGLHKQVANRLLEPFMWHTVIVTATEWQNFFALRCHADAQPEIRAIAEMMRTLHERSTPRYVGPGDWHLPFVAGYERMELGEEASALVSSARCARVSYLTHDGRRSPHEDLKLSERLRSSGHMSPFEHAARAENDAEFRGNFRGWTQFRKLIPGEAVYSAGTTGVSARPKKSA